MLNYFAEDNLPSSFIVCVQGSTWFHSHSSGLLRAKMLVAALEYWCCWCPYLSGAVTLLETRSFKIACTGRTPYFNGVCTGLTLLFTDNFKSCVAAATYSRAVLCWWPSVMSVIRPLLPSGRLSFAASAVLAVLLDRIDISCFSFGNVTLPVRKRSLPLQLLPVSTSAHLIFVQHVIAPIAEVAHMS